MTISTGDRLPDATFTVMTSDGPTKMTTSDVFAGKTVALFAVPGAFTPTCSAKHLPGYVEKAADFRAKGVDAIACTSVNDVFVMGAWGKDQGVGDDVTAQDAGFELLDRGAEVFVGEVLFGQRRLDRIYRGRDGVRALLLVAARRPS